MDNYISKEYIAEHIKACWVNGRPKYSPELHEVLSWIDEVPSEDVQPVRHGKWIKADSQQYFRKHYPCFTCSECGYRKDSQKTWNYCPNCGADMRGNETS